MLQSLQKVLIGPQKTILKKYQNGCKKKLIFMLSTKQYEILQKSSTTTKITFKNTQTRYE
jgi:hypothetical protein